MSLITLAVFVTPRIDMSAIREIEATGRKVTGVLAFAGAIWVLVSAVQILRL